MRNDRRLLASVLVVLTALSGTVARAQVPFLGGQVKRLAYQAAAKQLAPMVSEASPINLDWNNLYPTVDAPPGGRFHSSRDPRARAQQYRYVVAYMAKHPNEPVPLRPGDYVFFMRAHCTHAGAQAFPAHPNEPWPEYFQLAPLNGRRAPMLPALYARAQQAHIPYRQTQFLVWSITNGVSYEKMPPEQQAMFNKLLPQYRSLMEGDPVQRIRDRWESIRHKMPLLPTLDAAVDKLGAVGTTIKSLEQAQQATIANANNFEQSKATLAPQAIVSPVPVPVKSWSKLSETVYAKIKLPRNYHGIGSIVALMVRVLPSTGAVAQREAKGSARDFDTIAQAGGSAAGTSGVGMGGSVGMPGQNGLQAVTLGPTGAGGGDSGGSGHGSGGGPGNGPPPPPPTPNPPDLMYKGIKAINDAKAALDKAWDDVFNGGRGPGVGPVQGEEPTVTITGPDPSEDRTPALFAPTYGDGTYIPNAPVPR